MSERLAVFAYGSLVSPTSASQTLGRAVEIAAPARLRGWRRGWTVMRDNRACEKTFARSADGELLEICLGLGVEPAPDEPGPNGALIAVTAAELDRLDRRELRYDRVEVTATVEPEEHGFDRIATFTPKPAHHAPSPPLGASIIRTYAEAVEAAFAELGAEHLALFRETTGPPPVELVEAVLVRDEIPAGNPRAW